MNKTQIEFCNEFHTNFFAMPSNSPCNMIIPIFIIVLLDGSTPMLYIMLDTKL